MYINTQIFWLELFWMNCSDKDESSYFYWRRRFPSHLFLSFWPNKNKSELLHYQTGAAGGIYMFSNSSFKCFHGWTVKLNLKLSHLTLGSTPFPPLNGINLESFKNTHCYLTTHSSPLALWLLWTWWQLKKRCFIFNHCYVTVHLLFDLRETDHHIGQCNHI